jgi:hypothetical protein
VRTTQRIAKAQRIGPESSKSRQLSAGKDWAASGRFAGGGGREERVGWMPGPPCGCIL